jgi:ADP-dependent NAD(P)H-hydrate dehydratase / NAD(P)H-hydrate epimerase
MTGSPALAPVLRAADLRTIETAAQGQPLMERAGRAAAEVARRMAGERGGAVLVLAGPGNNGGDAFVVARWLRHWFFETLVVFHGDASKLPPDAAAAHRAFVEAGGATVADFSADWRGTLVVDGLFGIGLARALTADYAALVDRANASGVPILALDVPSGLDADTGATHGGAIRAAATATFIGLKPGLLTGDGVDRCGTISVHGLDLDPEATAAARGHRLDWPAIAAALPEVLRRRERNVHKGSFGTLAIVGGASGMVGATLLAGRAALHAGVGKVWVGFASGEFPAVDWGQPELMLRAADRVIGSGADALVCGPGLGTSELAEALVARAAANPGPLLLDADALNLIATRRGLAAAVAGRTAPTIVTPHPAEAARLLARSVAEVQSDRLAAAMALAEKLNASVVLKGAGSVVAHADRTWDINASGNVGLATAGTGDVLSGFAGAFLAQRIDARTSLRLAVCLHGAAADACVAGGRGPLGLTATELAPAARALLNQAALGS